MNRRLRARRKVKEKAGRAGQEASIQLQNKVNISNLGAFLVNPSQCVNHSFRRHIDEQHRLEWKTRIIAGEGLDPKYIMTAFIGRGFALEPCRDPTVVTQLPADYRVEVVQGNHRIQAMQLLQKEYPERWGHQLITMRVLDRSEWWLSRQNHRH